jgi:TRAP-type C4-dicarboxylate transport system substrate-binding protein
MAKFRTISTVAIISIAAAITTGAQAATLTAVDCWRPTNIISKVWLDKFVATAEKFSGGVIKIDYLGGAEVSPPRKSYRALQRGQFDLLHCASSYYVGAMPEAWAILATNQPVSTLRKNGGWEIMDEVHQKRVGAKLIAWGESETSFHIYAIDKPKIGKDGLPDLRGKKFRASGTYKPLLNALGASTIFVKSSEIYTALQRGLVSGFGFTDVAVPQLGVTKIIKWRIVPNFYVTNTVTTMNLGRYNKLTKKEKDALLTFALKYEKAALPYMAALKKKDVAKMHADGVRDLVLKGEARKKYLNTAYGAIWASLERKDSPYTARLKAKLYKPE